MKALLSALIVLGSLGPGVAQADGEGSAGTSVTERARLEIKPSDKAFGKIAIENPLGDVRVEGYDGTSIQIETIKRATTDDALDRLRVSLIPNPDGSVRISTTADAAKDPGADPSVAVPRTDVRIDLIIRAPRTARIEAVSSGGKLEISNLDAGGVLDSATGTITVRNVSGELSTSSISGKTHIEQAFGSIDAQTLGADVELDSITGQRLVASADRGKIAGRRVRSRDVELTTTTGAISLEAETGLRGRVMVASLHGDIDVRLRRTGAITVRARGAKVSIGAASKPQSDGWMTSSFGTVTGQDIPAFVEMRSRHGNVQLHLIESD